MGGGGRGSTGIFVQYDYKDMEGKKYAKRMGNRKNGENTQNR